jgi:hypothetical protein
MKKSNCFLMGMVALLLSFGLILAGCPTDTDPDPTPGNNGVPATPATVDAAGAKKATSDIFAKLSTDEQKEDFDKLLMGIVMGNDELKAILFAAYPEMDFPDDPSQLPENFWEAVAKPDNHTRKAQRICR